MSKNTPAASIAAVIALDGPDLPVEDQLPDSVKKLQKLLKLTEAKFEPLRAQKLFGSPWDAVTAVTEAIMNKLFRLTGDSYGMSLAYKQSKKLNRPSEDELQADYVHPDDVPVNVRAWLAKNASLLTSDATDAVRWCRIANTVNDDRYPAGDIELYRAVAEGDEIRPGDWVTTSFAYAEMHLAKYLNGVGQIISETVNGSDVLASPSGNYEEAIYAPLGLSGPPTTAVSTLHHYKGKHRDMAKSVRQGDALEIAGASAAMVKAVNPDEVIVTMPNRTGQALATLQLANCIEYPIIAFHGGDPDIEIDQFETCPSGAIWFTDSRDYAEFVSFDKFEKDTSKVYEKQLFIRRPLDLRNLPREHWNMIRDDRNFIEDAKAKGYDGIILNDENAGIKGISYIVFSPDQIRCHDDLKSELVPSGILDNPKFAEWFGGSFVVDESNAPKVVYHGSCQLADDGEAAFSQFLTGDSSGTFGEGIYFGTKEDANIYANPYSPGDDGNIRPAHIYPVYLSLKNPLVVDTSAEKGWGLAVVRALPVKVRARLELSDDFQADLKSEIQLAGHDGLIVTYEDGAKEYVVYDSRQIKSAIGNSGDFDGNNPDICDTHGMHPEPSLAKQRIKKSSLACQYEP